MRFLKYVDKYSCSWLPWKQKRELWAGVRSIAINMNLLIAHHLGGSVVQTTVKTYLIQFSLLPSGSSVYKRYPLNPSTTSQIRLGVINVLADIKRAPRLLCQIILHEWLVFKWSSLISFIVKWKPCLEGLWCQSCFPSFGKETFDSSYIWYNI